MRGVMLERPLSIADNVFRLTPSALAVSVTLSDSGSKQNVFSVSPGWGGIAHLHHIFQGRYI